MEFNCSGYKGLLGLSECGKACKAGDNLDVDEGSGWGLAIIQVERSIT